jgi:hydroxymethylbilane synthase
MPAVRILSRASDLARLQALLVGRALEARWPDLHVTYQTRTSAGDRDGVTPLSALADKGAFTADLSSALVSGDADAVVHSWKDLPLEGRKDTVLAATLERADPRDVLVMRRDVADARQRGLRILSSSPRRTWLLEQALPTLLPWPVTEMRFMPVRGNIQTRLRKLIEGQGEALVIAKAALDRLLGFGPPFEGAARDVREVLDRCLWMVLPMREVPGAPAQGALAVEVARDGTFVERFRAISHQPTWNAITREREVLAAYGGGCHEALGVTVLPREYGQVVSVRGRSSTGRLDEGWSLNDDRSAPPRTTPTNIWPRPEERHRGARRSLDVAQPADNAGYWIARADALPETWPVPPDRIVWAAGTTTWRRLAARGIWVHGCADGLGDVESPAIELLSGRALKWHRLTHRAAAARADAADPETLATYVVEERLPEDLGDRTHFFWTSGTLFHEALARWPQIRTRWHASGPGRTWRTLMKALEPNGHVGVWLDYEQWRQQVLET